MIRIIFPVVLILTDTFLFAQQASDYFPQTPGYRWDYKVIPLDSVNNEIDSMTYYRVDSFAVAANFMGRNGDLVLSKTGTNSLINFIPFTDSSYFSFENTEGYYYFRVSNLGNLVAVLDSAGLDSTLIGVVQSFEDWYSAFRFSQPVNSEYTIFSKDTTLNIGGTDLPLRFEYFGKRLADETIQTDAGTFTCKKFLLSTVVSYIIFPPFTIELIRLETTKWISANIWLVQELSPSKTVDLSRLGYGSFNIPGTKTELIPLITDIKNSGVINPGFALSQNFPNPFNPETNIQFTLPEAGKVTLKIYDVLGKEVLTLFDGERNSGSYSVKFNPELNRLASGFYVYEINFKGMHLSRKMIYLK
jgi:hypothetical protein